jgi:O-antigen/teichoic acid export membrane protein
MSRAKTWQQSSTMALFQSTGAKLSIIVLNAATGILSARALRAAGRGELAAMILWNVLLANAFTFGIPSALTYQLRNNPKKQSELVGTALLLGLVTSFFAMLVGFVGMKHWIPQYSDEVIFYSRLFLLNIPIFGWSLIGRAAVESGGDFKTSNLSLTIAPLLTLAGLVALQLTHTFTPVAASWIYVTMGVPSFLLVTWRLVRTFAPTLRHVVDSARLLMSYGVRSYGIDLCGTMAFYVDQALVIHLLDPRLMGAYVVALSLSRMLNAFHTAVAMVLFPRIASQPTAVILDLTGRAVRITTMLTATCGLLIAAFGPGLLGLLYGAEYRSASGVVRILVIEVVLSGVAQVLSQAFMALGRPGLVTTLQVIGLMLTVPLMLVFIPRFGVEGAAGALLISTTVRLAFVLISFQKVLKVECPRILARGADVATMFASLKSLRQSQGSVG